MAMELIKIALMLAMYGAGWAFITAELAKRTIANGTSRDRDQAIKWASRIALAWPLILPFLAALGLVVWVAGAVKNQIKNRLPMPDAELNALEREVGLDGHGDPTSVTEAKAVGYQNAAAEVERYRQHLLDDYTRITVCRKCLCPLTPISTYTYIHSPELNAPSPCDDRRPSETTLTRAEWRRAIQAQDPEYQRMIELKNNLGKVKMRAPGVERAIWVKESAVPIHARSGWKVVEGPYGPEDLATFEIVDEVEELRKRYPRTGPDKIMILDEGMAYEDRPYLETGSTGRAPRPYLVPKAPRYPETSDQRTHRLLHGGGSWLDCPKCAIPQSWL